MGNVYYIDVYKNVLNGNIIIVPRAFDERGLVSYVNYPYKINSGYTIFELGKIIFEAFNYVRNHSVIESKFGVKEWIFDSNSDKNNFYKNWINIGICLNIEKISAFGIESGYRVSCSKFDGHGFLGTNYMPTFHLPLDATEEQLGETVLRAFDAIPGIALKSYDDHTNKRKG